MTIENENNEGAGAGAGTDEHEQGTDDRAKAYAERDKARAEAKAAKTELAKYEGEKRKAAEAAERAAGDWKSVESRYQTTIRELEEQNAKLAGEVEGHVKGGRRRSFLDAIVAEGKIGNRVVAEALLPTLGLADDAPEAFDERDVKRAVKALQGKAPELFTAPKTTIKPPPGPGQRPTDEHDPDHWKKLGERLSSTAVGGAYGRVTGKTG
jgi:hypothetical protein